MTCTLEHLSVSELALESTLKRAYIATQLMREQTGCTIHTIPNCMFCDHEHFAASSGPRGTKRRALFGMGKPLTHPSRQAEQRAAVPALSTRPEKHPENISYCR